MADDEQAIDDGGPREGETEVFVEYEEKRTIAPGPGRTSKSKHVHFNFKDADGKKVLGAQGFDHGDAHYVYKTAPNFTTKYGTIECHNRKELVAWLEMVIKESRMQAEGTVELEKARLGAPTEDNPEGLYYVDTRHEKNVLSDGRKLNRWYLIDQHKQAHLAVRGEERETRDGHYNYTALDPFKSKHPLTCSNQTGVMHFLEKWLTHHAPDSALHVGDHIKDVNPRSPKSRSPNLSPKRLSSDGQRMLEPTRVSKRARTPSYKGAESFPGEAPIVTPSGVGTPPTPAGGARASPVAFPDMSDGALPTPVPFKLDVPVMSEPTPTLVLEAPPQAPVPPSAASAPPAAPAPKLSSMEDAMLALPGPFGMSMDTPRAAQKMLGPSSTLPTTQSALASRAPKLGGAAEQSHMKRVKTLRAAAEAQATALRAGVSGELRQQTFAMRAVQEASKDAALRWAVDPPHKSDFEHVLLFARVLRGALVEAGITLPERSPHAADIQWDAARVTRNSGGAGGEGPTVSPNKDHIRVLEALEALREIGTSYVNCQLLVSLDVIPLVHAACNHPHTNVAAMAANTLKCWRQAATHNVLVLTDLMMAVDPVDTLERGLADGSIEIPLPESLKASLLDNGTAHAPGDAHVTPATAPTPAPPGDLAESSVPAASGTDAVTAAPPQSGPIFATPEAAAAPPEGAGSPFSGSVFDTPASMVATPSPSPDAHQGAGMFDSLAADSLVPSAPPQMLDLGSLVADEPVWSPTGSRARKRATLSENDRDSSGLLISHGRCGDMSGLYSVGFGSSLSLGGNNGTSFGSKHLPDAAVEDADDMGSWGSASDEEVLGNLPKPSSTSMPALVEYLEWCIKMLGASKHRNVAKLCEIIKGHVDGCARENALQHPEDVKEMQQHAKELERQGNEVKQGMSARDCHHFVLVCLQHLREIQNIVTNAIATPAI